MKRIFISHPYAGIRENFRAITEICRKVMNLGVMPVSPVHSFRFLEEHVPEERLLALGWCENLVPICDELWLFGDWQTSEGCQLERSTAFLEPMMIRIVTGWDGDIPVFKGEMPTWLSHIKELMKYAKSS